MKSVGIFRGILNRLWKLFVVAVDADGGTNGIIVIACVVCTSSCSGSFQELVLKSHGGGCFSSKTEEVRKLFAC